MNIEEAEKVVQSMRDEEVKKLTDVGFTKEQAEVLIEMMRSKALMGGFF